MPWFCPACRTEIQRPDAEIPQDLRAYRCDLCRLELVFDGTSGRMRVPNYDAEDLIVRPMFDRRRNDDGTPPAAGDRRRRERRHSRDVH